MIREHRSRRPLRFIECLEARTLLTLAPEGSLLIGVLPVTLNRVEQALQKISAIGRIEPLSEGMLRFTPNTTGNLATLSTQVRRIPGVRFVERDQNIKVEAVTPSDPSFSQQWGLENSGNVDIDASQAWGYSTGSVGTIVAIIDSGIDVNHPDLASRLWVNPREVAGNGFDDDRNGKPDDVNGWNFLDNNANLSDGASHGTHVAGIIAAASDNGIGVTGIDWNARIMALKFINSNGDGAISDAVQAIYYAVNNGARVINASWGGPGPSKALNDAMRFAASRNVVFVTAAGNESLNNDVYRSYPASYRLSNTLVVAAVDQSGRLAGFSNFGAKTVDVAAPGVNIRSTLPGGTYGNISGTSMAAPFVTGVVSLLISQNPNMSAAQLVQRVVGTTKQLSSLSNKVVGGGIVSAGNALNPAIATRKPGAPASTASKSTAQAKALIKTKLSANAGDNLRAEILGSDEYYMQRGGTNQSFLTTLYEDVVARPVTLNEANTWLAAINSGMRRADVARALLGSAEAQRTKVARWYKLDLLAPASIAALKNFGPVIQAANRLVNKTGESLVHASLYASRDFSARYGGSALGTLAGLYQRVMGREIRPDEANYWLSQLGQGTKISDIALGLLASPEGRRTRVALWYQNDLQRTASLEELKSDPNVMAWAAALVD
jgi:subtilisin family serine protease